MRGNETEPNEKVQISMRHCLVARHAVDAQRPWFGYLSCEASLSRPTIVGDISNHYPVTTGRFPIHFP